MLKMQANRGFWVGSVPRALTILNKVEVFLRNPR